MQEDNEEQEEKQEEQEQEEVQKEHEKKHNDQEMQKEQEEQKVETDDIIVTPSGAVWCRQCVLGLAWRRRSGDGLLATARGRLLRQKFPSSPLLGGEKGNITSFPLLS